MEFLDTPPQRGEAFFGFLLVHLEMLSFFFGVMFTFCEN
jgi:hypothetical protein